MDDLKKENGFELNTVEQDLFYRESEMNESYDEAQISEPFDCKPENDIEKKKRTSDDGPLDFFDLIQCVGTALVIGLIIFMFVFRVIGVDGTSMYSTLYHGDRMFVSDLFYTPEHGDIIILRTEAYEQPLVKRVIAVGGQTVDIDFTTGDVSVNGQVISEPYIYEITRESEGFEGPVTVPEGYVFVMGDNRNHSNDSRNSRIGFIDERAIIGKVYWIIFPAADESGRREWSRIGSVYKGS